jgi:hypothetical protein
MSGPNPEESNDIITRVVYLNAPYLERFKGDALRGLLVYFLWKQVLATPTFRLFDSEESYITRLYQTASRIIDLAVHRNKQITQEFIKRTIASVHDPKRRTPRGRASSRKPRGSARSAERPRTVAPKQVARPPTPPTPPTSPTPPKAADRKRGSRLPLKLAGAGLAAAGGGLAIRHPGPAARGAYDAAYATYDAARAAAPYVSEAARRSGELASEAAYATYDAARAAAPYVSEAASEAARRSDELASEAARTIKGIHDDVRPRLSSLAQSMGQLVLSSRGPRRRPLTAEEKTARAAERRARVEERERVERPRLGLRPREPAERLRESRLWKNVPRSERRAIESRVEEEVQRLDLEHLTPEAARKMQNAERRERLEEYVKQYHENLPPQPQLPPTPPQSWWTSPGAQHLTALGMAAVAPLAARGR